MNAGPYTDHDAQEYRPGPMAKGCGLCALPRGLCVCTVFDRIRAHADVITVALLTVACAAAIAAGGV